MNNQKHKDILDLYSQNTSDLLTVVNINRKPIKKIKIFDSEEERNKIKIREERDKN